MAEIPSFRQVLSSTNIVASMYVSGLRTFNFSDDILGDLKLDTEIACKN
jgi:hypothetical protein